METINGIIQVAALLVGGVAVLAIAAFAGYMFYLRTGQEEGE